VWLSCDRLGQCDLLRRLEEPAGRKLLGVSDHHHPPPASQNRDGFGQPALVGFIKEKDVLNTSNS
jgi:hypothetical protein